MCGFGLGRHCLAYEPLGGGRRLARQPPQWFDRLGCFLHLEVVGADACGLLAGLRIWPLKQTAATGGAGAAEGAAAGLARLADGPIFSELPAAWAGCVDHRPLSWTTEPRPDQTHSPLEPLSPTPL